MHRVIPRPNTKKLSFLSGMLVVAVVLAGLLGATVQLGRAAAATPGPACDTDAIIHCGFSTPSNFISKVRANNSGNGHSDLQAVYAHQFYSGEYLSKGMYDNFAASAVKGTAYRDGRIVVNGQVVARNVKNVGRLASMAGAGYSTQKVNGQTYYTNTNDAIYASGYDTFPVYVLFDASGTMQFAVLATCGNPLFGPPVKTSASCNNLQKTKVNDTTYKFSASTNLQGNATIKKYVFNFGDGTTKTITSKFGQSVTHTYSSPGTFTASVTEYVSVPGNNKLQLASVSMCTKQVTIPKPNYSCVQLVGAILDKQSNTYKLTATGSYASGTTPVSAAFTFGDGKTQTVPMTGTTASVSHEYPDSGHTYAASVTLRFNSLGKTYTATSAACRTTVAVTIPACQALTGAILDAATYKVQFTAVAVTNGATLSAADFTFGDGTTQSGVKSATTTSVVVTHDYAGAGSYDATAVLHFTANGKSWTAPACKALVKPTAVVSECKPGVPVGSPLCTPCQYDTTLSADSPQCVPPTPPELPNTGAGNTIAIFGSMIVVGFLAYRQLLFRRHKLAYIAAQNGTSPLPLGNPLDEQRPLAGTPYATTPRPRSLRRPRQF